MASLRAKHNQLPPLPRHFSEFQFFVCLRGNIRHCSEYRFPETVSPGVAKVATAAGVQPPATEKQATSTAKPEKAQPFAFADFTWLNGNAARKI